MLLNCVANAYLGEIMTAGRENRQCLQLFEQFDEFIDMRYVRYICAITLVLVNNDTSDKLCQNHYYDWI